MSFNSFSLPFFSIFLSLKLEVCVYWWITIVSRYCRTFLFFCNFPKSCLISPFFFRLLFGFACLFLLINILLIIVNIVTTNNRKDKHKKKPVCQYVYKYNYYSWNSLNTRFPRGRFERIIPSMNINCFQKRPLWKRYYI